jgi:hypothetical protein
MVKDLSDRGFQVTVSDVFEHPTLGGLASLMSTLGAGAERGASGEPTFTELWSQAIGPWTPGRPASLVKLADGSREPFFCVHWGTGNIGFLRRFAKLIGGGRPVYGFQHPALVRRERVQLSVRELAETYLSELLEVQPVGPYVLGGVCNGGMIALEMARLLTDAGHDVAFLAQINSTPANAPGEVSPGDGLDGIYQVRLAALRQRFGVKNLAASAPQVMAKLQADDINYYDGHESPDELLWFQAVFAAMVYAQAHYEPRPFAGPTMVYTNLLTDPLFDPYWLDIAPQAERMLIETERTLHILTDQAFQEDLNMRLSADFGSRPVQPS